MSPRLSQRLADREEALVQEALALSAADEVRRSDRSPPRASPTMTATRSLSPSVPDISPLVSGNDDLGSQAQKAVQDEAEDMDLEEADADMVEDIAVNTASALQVQSSIIAGATQDFITSSPPIPAVTDNTTPVRSGTDAQHDASAASISPTTPPSTVFTTPPDDGKTLDGHQMSSNVVATPEKLDDEGQTSTSTRRIMPKRRAATLAQGTYTINMNIMEDDAESRLALQTPLKNSAKRKRRVTSPDNTSSAVIARDAVQAASDITDIAKTPQKKARPSTSARSKGNTKVVPRSSSVSDTGTLAAEAVDNDEEDDDFSPTVGRPNAKNAVGQTRQYGLRLRKAKESVGDNVKEETEDASNEEEVKSGEEIAGKRTRKAVRKEKQSMSLQESLRGKQAAKQRRVKDSKASLSDQQDAAKQRAKGEVLRIVGDFTNKYKIKFGSTPFVNNTRPSRNNCHQVFDLLKKHHERDDIKLERYPNEANGVLKGDAQGPMHAGEDFTFHAILKTILSQATNNENALTVEQTLIHRFRFDFLGVKVKGSCPNYHAMRIAPQKVLAKALASGGLHNLKAKQIQVCLNTVHAYNMALATPAERLDDARMGESFDFNPGMLSLSYMHSMSQQEKFDHLVSMPGIGVKTAACILCFNYEYPVFAVDTHVYRLSRILRWLPKKASTVDQAFMHLDKRVPAELKYGLHQAFWHHGQACIRCRAGSDERTKGWAETNCPIEHLVDRSLKDPQKGKKPKTKPEDDDGEEDKKPKKPRAARTVYPHSKLTPARAAEMGYELRTITIDDGFGVRRANFSGKPVLKWVLASEGAGEVDEEMEMEEEME